MKREKDKYIVISVINALVRNFVLPNPYSTFFQDEAKAVGFNFLIGGTIIHSLTFLLTKLFYKKGEDSSSFGSLCYFIWYVVNTFIFIVVGHFIKNIYLFVGILLFIYILFIVVFFKINYFSKSDF